VEEGNEPYYYSAAVALSWPVVTYSGYRSLAATLSKPTALICAPVRAPVLSPHRRPVSNY